MPEQPASVDGQIIKFLRERDYRLVRELGRGACGRTVLLHDDVIDEHFVCKKYAPAEGVDRSSLFDRFVREIKLLHNVQHENIVRVFNYFLYPKESRGYILMEYVEGVDIQDAVAQHPENINELFLQAISGFSYLQARSILHRDIRPPNLLVRDDGVLKIIDLGFGKDIGDSGDFDKSISLNWWCDTPAEFVDSRYDFATEVYFVGKLFEKCIARSGISHFKHTTVLGGMCKHEPSDRIQTFADVEKQIRSAQFSEIGFSEAELETYRLFADQLLAVVSRIQDGAKYYEDIKGIGRQLERVWRGFMLETFAPDPTTVVRCFVDGAYFYNKSAELSVESTREFLQLFKSSTEEKRRIILANLHTRLDAVPRYAPKPINSDGIPF